jgi:hypothetical protein
MDVRTIYIRAAMSAEGAAYHSLGQRPGVNARTQSRER